MRSYPASIDLHVHLRGTIEPEIAAQLAARHKVKLPSTLFDADGSYQWSDFKSFLWLYDAVGRVVRSPEDLHYLARSYLERCAREGTIYVEFMLSPDHSSDNGIPYDEQIASVAEAISDANALFGINAGLIVTCVRHRGPTEALELAELVAENPNPVVVGFGLTGNELRFDVSEFEAAFIVARDSGLGLTAHSGEWAQAASVLRSVDSLGLTRIGHGIKVVDDVEILSELSERGVGFEVCLSSNAALGLCGSVKDHPLPKLVSAGCKVSLATDDPAYFATNPANEYRLAAEEAGLLDVQLHQITMDAIDMAFCDQGTKDALLHKLMELCASN